MKPWLYAAIGIMAASAVSAQIYADFQTSLGNFSCELYHEDAPKAVANFIGLAEGSKRWIDSANGVVKSGPYYDGLVFHRVLDGLGADPTFRIIQAGSQNSMGTDGPGYTIRDEFQNGHLHEAYTLSMANSGTPNSNGSQFFITRNAMPGLDGRYSIFGTVVSGQASVNEIQQVETGPNDKPLEPVTIHSVTIRREGDAAEVFDIHAQQLPIVDAMPGKLSVSSDKAIHYASKLPQPAGSLLQVYQSPDLKNWQKLGEIYQAPGSSGYSSFNLGQAGNPKRFFNFSLVHYPDAAQPVSNANQKLQIFFGNRRLDFQFNAAGNAGDVEHYVNNVLQSEGSFFLADYASTPYGANWHMQTTIVQFISVIAGFTVSESNTISGTHQIRQNGFTIGSGDLLFGDL